MEVQTKKHEMFTIQTNTLHGRPFQDFKNEVELFFQSDFNIFVRLIIWNSKSEKVNVNEWWVIFE